ncbi:1,4-alpha-glucan branching protein GlgB [Halodesulfovibrio marinisediminis]|uniref:1,4-alpha-glucan branching enzyme GlgB n=1 Tax=Halodesulfovibrio marinisediminis DSM 17456 TaxID=1121457 RepID=A0A1N6DEF2_9BACT|nr:1,4-alpha-glucan branching protein GlgB [Halodesulfovibrio marinisediminis]SIN69165.1 1,4-alpha-glucan branching enzyme [Halodesulfovibrio marinisediminis DSM 17456]
MRGKLKSVPAFFEPFDLYLFGKGTHWDLYRFLGAHSVEVDGVKGYRFAVWAPNAQEVHVAGDFNEWHFRELPLYPVGESGIWAAFVAGVQKGQLYKFSVLGEDGRDVYKVDPFAFYCELRPGVASRTWELDNYTWADDEWMQERRKQGPPLDQPISIYEVHLGSWCRDHDSESDGFLPYGQIAELLINYVKDMGFTHVELLPVAEHPLDESWGYQTSNYYAPTSRFGTPEEFKGFVDALHNAGIGIFLDWVPAHFPKDDWCLGRFDGSALYEHLDPQLGEHPDWGTYIFNYGRHEVRNFLFSNALYWLREFHIDGLRIDAVASMLYLDYSRCEGEWCPNKYGGRENLEAIDFLRELNRVAHEQFPGVAMIAEESTSWPGVSRPLYTGGLGFTFKWNMGWMHDSLTYFSTDPIYRSYAHNSLTFSMLYAFSENFILPLSHDEVVHGKGTILSKMSGDVWQQQANLRLLFSYMWAHPGKKMIFMGSEFGQWNEWNPREEIDWCLLQFPAHDGIRTLVRDLNRMLVTEEAMHKDDVSWEGFRWVDFSDYGASVISFVRMGGDGAPLFWIFNFTPVVRHHYRVASPKCGVWEEILNSDSMYYGGSNVGNIGAIETCSDDFGGEGFIELTLPPLGAICLKYQGGR